MKKLRERRGISERDKGGTRDLRGQGIPSGTSKRGLQGRLIKYHRTVKMSGPLGLVIKVSLTNFERAISVLQKPEWVERALKVQNSKGFEVKK